MGDAQFLTYFLSQFATYRSRHHYFTEKRLRQAQGLYQRTIPRACTGIQQFRSRSDAVLIVGDTGQVIAEQVGHKQQPVGNLELRIIAFQHAVKLEKRIDGHHLNTRFRIMPGKRRFIKEFFGQTIRPRVTIADRIAQQVTVLVNQSEVHSPRINADAADGVALTNRLTDAVLHLLEQSREIPIDMIAHTHLPVGETANLFQLQYTPVDGTGHHATASTSEVHR